MFLSDPNMVRRILGCTPGVTYVMTNCFFFWRALAASGVLLRLQKCQKWKDRKYLMLSLGACFFQRPETRLRGARERRPLAQKAIGHTRLPARSLPTGQQVPAAPGSAGRSPSDREAAFVGTS